MENSPIVLAHNHARSALLETRRSNPVAASEEHDLAATEFATAANGTSDSEAHRILLLLEDHHKKLGQILRSRHENASQHAQSHTASTSSLPPIQSKSAEAAATAISSPPRTSSPETSNPTIPKLSQNLRSLQREGSSSLASNLASARGIPGSQQRRGSPASPTLSAQHAGGKMVSRPKPLDGQTRDTGNAAPRKNSATLDSLRPAGDVDQDTIVSAESQPQEAATSDAPFQQFYNTFESLISKVSAPLAFAGLPLTSPTTSTATPPTDTKAPKPPVPSSRRQPPPTTTKPDNSSAEIDYSTLISRAALRAVRDGPSNHPSVAESFYVVPTTGGTVSYAGILNREASDQSGRHHGRQLSNISETTVDDFVDARETIPPGSPELTRLDAPPPPPVTQSTGPLRRSRHSTTGSGSGSGSATLTARPFKQPPDTQTVGGKTLEELHLENTALKHLSDTLSKRLHMWETTSQNQGAALHQSIRLQLSQQRSSSLSPTASVASPPASRRGASDVAAIPSEEERKRVEELEEMLRKLEKEKDRQDRENEKLRSVVGRYRERWERLKEGAKSRREGAGANAGGTAAGAAGGGGGSGEADVARE